MVAEKQLASSSGKLVRRIKTVQLCTRQRKVLILRELYTTRQGFICYKMHLSPNNKTRVLYD